MRGHRKPTDRRGVGEWESLPLVSGALDRAPAAYDSVPRGRPDVGVGEGMTGFSLSLLGSDTSVLFLFHGSHSLLRRWLVAPGVAARRPRPSCLVGVERRPREGTPHDPDYRTSRGASEDQRKRSSTRCTMAAVGWFGALGSWQQITQPIALQTHVGGASTQPSEHESSRPGWSGGNLHSPSAGG